MALHGIDLALVGAYMVFVLVVGWRLSHRAGTSRESFFLAGRSLPWWLAGTSMVATSFASDTPLLVTGFVRDHGIARNWIWWNYALAGTLAAFVFARLWRRSGCLTDVGLVEMRYAGRPAALLRLVMGAYNALVANGLVLCWVLLAMGKILGVLLDVDQTWAIAAALVVALAYSLMGGLMGVVVTDLVQFVLAIAGSWLIAAWALDAAGGLDTVIAAVRETARPGTLDLFPSPGPGTVTDSSYWTPALASVCVFLGVGWWAQKNADSSPVYVQRMMACKDERHAVGATLWSQFAFYVIRPWPWILTALASIVLLPELADSESAYPEMMRLLPPGLLGLALCSLVAAFMSTVDTHVNLGSAYLVNDLYRRFLRPGASERECVRVGRIAGLGLGGLAAFAATRVSTVSGLFEFFVTLLGGIGPALLLRWFWWRANAWTEIAAMATSFASGWLLGSGLFEGTEVGARILAALGPLADGGGTPARLVFAALSSLTVCVAVTLATRPVPMETLVEFHRRVRPPGIWGPVRRAAMAMEPAGVATGPPLPAGTGRAILGTLALIWGLLIGTGQWLLHSPGDALPWLAAALVGAALVLPLLRRGHPFLEGRAGVSSLNGERGP